MAKPCALFTNYVVLHNIASLQTHAVTTAVLKIMCQFEAMWSSVPFHKIRGQYNAVGLDIEI